MRGSSRVIRSGRDGWESVDRRPYKEDGQHFRSVTRQMLLGEDPGQTTLGFVVRYFEIGAGGYSSLERHGHAHAVLVLRGRGRVILGRDVFEVHPFDCVYVAPDATHQFQAADDESLGILCIVNRERDRPHVIPPRESGNSAARG
jgi:quercetin dioxygenase-like cupin family protein